MPPDGAAGIVPVIQRPLAGRITAVAKAIDVSPKTVRRLVKEGHLQSFNAGTNVRIPWTAVEEFMTKGGAKL